MDRTRTDRGRSTRPRPWWLQGELRCHHCLQRHADSFEVRCSRCDGATCRDCAVVVRRTRLVFCPECTIEE